MIVRRPDDANFDSVDSLFVFVRTDEPVMLIPPQDEPQVIEGNHALTLALQMPTDSEIRIQGLDDVATVEYAIAGG